MPSLACQHQPLSLLNPSMHALLPAALRPQGFEVVRLKDKLGTRQLPTAELRLTGMRALKVGRAAGPCRRCRWLADACGAPCGVAICACLGQPACAACLF